MHTPKSQTSTTAKYGGLVHLLASNRNLSRDNPPLRVPVSLGSLLPRRMLCRPVLAAACSLTPGLPALAQRRSSFSHTSPCRTYDYCKIKMPLIRFKGIPLYINPGRHGCKDELLSVIFSLLMPEPRRIRLLHHCLRTSLLQGPRARLWTPRFLTSLSSKSATTAYCPSVPSPLFAIRSAPRSAVSCQRPSPAPSLVPSRVRSLRAQCVVSHRRVGARTSGSATARISDAG